MSLCQKIILSSLLRILNSNLEFINIVLTLFIRVTQIWKCQICVTLIKRVKIKFPSDKYTEVYSQKCSYCLIKNNMF